MATLPIYWKPRSDLTQIFLLDISRAQRKAPPEDDTDWGKFDGMLPQPAAVWIRDGISWGYADPWYAYFRDALTDLGIPTAPYHVVYPGQPVVAQFNKMKANVGGTLVGKKAAMVDGEVTLGQTRKVVTRDTGEMCDRLSQATGAPAVLYTRPQFVRDCMEWEATWYDNVLWVLALYTFSGRERNPTDVYAVLKDKRMSKVGIPAQRVIAVQTAKMGNGRAYGFQSHALDYDRWVAPASQFNALWRAA